MGRGPARHVGLPGQGPHRGVPGGDDERGPWPNQLHHVPHTLWRETQGTDPEDVIKNAFSCFDEDNVGLIHEDRLRELLTTIGDRFSDDDVDEMYREAPIKNGMFDYNEFTRILKHGAKEGDEA